MVTPVKRPLLVELPLLFVAFTIGMLLTQCQPYDDTDDVKNRERSGMILFTDHGTGCQYLGRFWGGLQPRLDQNGKQVCT